MRNEEARPAYEIGLVRLQLGDLDKIACRLETR
jgi:hypothetical protein